MDRLKQELVELVLNLPPEIPLMAKQNHGYNRIREKDFFRKMAFWVQPGIDTSCFALQVLQLINLLFPDANRKSRIVDFVKSIEIKLKQFVLDCYDIKTGGFFQTKANQYPSLHATHCVLSLIKAIDSIKSNQKINFDEPMNIASFDRFLYSNQMNSTSYIRDRIPCFLQSCYDPSTGGFFEIPFDIIRHKNLKRDPGINQTASAHWILYNLSIPSKSVCDIAEKDCKDKIIDFLRLNKVEKDSWISYKNSVSDKKPWVCSLYYAERISRQVNIKPSIDNLIGTYRFIISAKQEKSGFGAGGIKMKPNLIHTKDAISLLRRYFSDYSNEISKNKDIIAPKTFVKIVIKDVSNFIKEAYYKGAFSIAEPFYYLPNV